MIRILVADVLNGLAQLGAESVQCIVTSPPYWGLRDYGTPGQIGLETTPGEYIDRMVEIGAELWRVLRKDGTLWINLGDCYATGAGKVGDHPGGGEQGARWRGDVNRARDGRRAVKAEKFATNTKDPKSRTALGPVTQPNRMPIDGLKPKDLVGIPWRVALALQAAGWWLRSDIVWNKSNPMPESVRDRPTRAHEYLFLMTRARRYYYDGDAIREPFVTTDWNPIDNPIPPAGGPRPHAPDKIKSPHGQGFTRRAAESRAGISAEGYDERKWQDRSDGRSRPPITMVDREYDPRGRNKRSVWDIPTCPYPDAHFATFPVALVEPCIKAGSRRGDLVLDPFCGAGTTGLVADRLGRSFVGIELNPTYAEMARRRIETDCPLLTTVHLTAELTEGDVTT